MTLSTHEIRKHEIRGLGATKTYTNKTTGHKVSVHPVEKYNDGCLRVFCEAKINGQVRTRTKVFHPNQIANKDQARGETIAELLNIFADEQYTYRP